MLKNVAAAATTECVAATKLSQDITVVDTAAVLLHPPLPPDLLQFKPPNPLSLKHAHKMLVPLPLLLPP